MCINFHMLKFPRILKNEFAELLFREAVKNIIKYPLYFFLKFQLS